MPADSEVVTKAAPVEEKKKKVPPIEEILPKRESQGKKLESVHFVTVLMNSINSNRHTMLLRSIEDSTASCCAVGFGLEIMFLKCLKLK